MRFVTRRDFILHLLLYPHGHLLESQFAQLQNVILRKEIIERGVYLVGFVYLTGFQPIDKLLGGQVDIHHFIRHGQYAVGNTLPYLYARNFLHGFVQSLDVLDIHRRDNADTRFEYLHHILPPFRIAAPLDVGVRQFVHDDDFGMEIDDGLRIHFLQLLPLVKQFA